MKPVISLSVAAFLAALLLTSPGLTQNISISLQPINPPIQIPAPGGSFSYTATVRNTGTLPHTFNVWIMVRLPNQSLYGPVAGPARLTVPGGTGVSRMRSQSVPDSAPAGNYFYLGRVGTYPNIVLSADSFAFVKTTVGSQLWVARYNGPGNYLDEAKSLAVDHAGNVYVTGWSWGAGTYFDYSTVKYNSAGVQQWVARYDGPGNTTDLTFAVAADSAGNVYVTGESVGDGTDYDYCTIKYNSAGVQQWVARYNGSLNYWDAAYCLAVDGAGNVYVSGTSNEIGSGPNMTTTIRYNSIGEQQWVAYYHGPGNGGGGAFSLVLDGAGNVYITGETDGQGTAMDYTTIKYDSSGVEQWVARYNDHWGDDDYAHDVAVDADENVYVTGGSYGYTTIKYNSTGVQQWIANYPPGESEALALTLDVEGNVYVTGYSDVDLNCDYATIKYNSAGVQQWVSRYDGPGHEYDAAYSLAVDSTGAVYVTGYSYNSGYIYDKDYATIKYDSMGVQQWVARYNGPGNNADNAVSLALDRTGNVIVTGTSTGLGTETDYCTIKYSGAVIPNWQQPEALVFGAQEPATKYALNPNYPNPFNATTAISYQLSASSHVRLTVWDSAGRLVETLVDGWREAGRHEVTFDASALPSGIYFARLTTGDFTAVQKMVVLK